MKIVWYVFTIATTTFCGIDVMLATLQVNDSTNRKIFLQKLLNHNIKSDQHKQEEKRDEENKANKEVHENNNNNEHRGIEEIMKIVYPSLYFDCELK